MWKALLFCFLVALGAAEQQHGAWRQHTEYRYKVRTQTLTAIPNLKNQWVGMFTKADLTIQPYSNDILVGKLQNGQYSEWHDALPQGNPTYQPTSKLNYQPMEINSKPFEIRLNKGAIHSIAVDKDMTNVELNQLKSIISQLQVDIQARNLMKNEYHQLPQNIDDEDNANQAMYRVMEPTVTGKCETVYDISRIPLYLAQSYPEFVSNATLGKNEYVYEAYKTKNYSNCEQRMGYNFGVSGLNEWKPNTNQMGSLSKSAVSRVIFTGNFNEFTIRSSATTNRIVKANTEKDTQHDSVVVSKVNLTLASMEQNNGKPYLQSEQLIDVGNLVYSYDLPSDSKNTLRPKKDSSESEEDEEEEEGSQNFYNYFANEQQMNNEYENAHRQQGQQKNSRARRSIFDNSRQNRNNRYQQGQYEDYSEEYEFSKRKEYFQPKPTLKYAPENPLLTYFIGNKGASIQHSNQFNAPAEVQNLVNEISEDLNNPNEVPIKNTLRKFNILAKVIRTMNAEQIEKTTRLIEEKQGKQSKAQKVYRDALVSAGTGPAVNELMNWIEERKLIGEDAAEVITAFPKTIREPTQEMLQRFFDFVKNDAVRNQENANTTAGIAFTRFLFHAQVNKKSSRNYYPVESYGRLSDSNNEFVSQKVVPYFARVLEVAVNEKNAPKTLYAIRALGNLGHAQIPKVFEQYLNGKMAVSDFQRLAIVLAFDKYIINYPQLAHAILFKMYQNKGETHEIRSAAVFQLMRSNPPAALIQRLAEETNTEENNDVRAAVRSAIESAARLTNSENAQIAQNAKSALDLLKPETQGVQYSRTHLRDYVVKGMEAAYEKQSSYVVNKDSFIPSGVHVSTTGNIGGFRRRVEFQAFVSSIEELMNAFNDKLKPSKSNRQRNNNNNNNGNGNDYQNDYDESQGYEQGQQTSNWSAEKIFNLLKFKPNAQKQLEGQIWLNILNSERFIAFNKQTFEQLPHKVQKIVDELRNGYEVKYTKLYNQDDVTISFPVESGIPFTFTYRTPTLVQVNGRVSAQSQPEVFDNAQNKIRIPETVNVNAEIEAVYSVHNEVSVSFINPSTRQRYSAGYDKKAQVIVPFNVNSDIDIRNREIRTVFKPFNQDKSTKVLQMGSWPFTGRDDAFNLRPLPESQHVKEIRTSATHESKFQFGEKETGFAFVIKGTQAKYSNQLTNAFVQLRKHDLTSFYLFGQENISPEHYSLSVILDAKRSSSKSAKFTVKYGSEYNNGSNKQQSEERNHPRSRGQSVDESENMAVPTINAPNSQERREQFLRNSAEGMTAQNVADVLDVAIEFNGSTNQKYVATISAASSKTEGKSRVLMFFQKSSTDGQTKAVHVQVDAKYQSVDELVHQYNQAGNDHTKQPFSDIKFKLSYSLDNVLELASIRGKIEMKQSHEFNEYMKEQSQLKWSYNTDAQRKNTADIFNVDLHFPQSSVEVLKKEFGVKASNVYNYLRYATHLYLNEEDFEYQGQNDKVSFEVRFSPDMSFANATLKTSNMKSEWKGVHVPKMIQNVVVVPRNWNFFEEVARDAIQNRDTCFITENGINTFENQAIKHATFGKTWHLAVHKMRESVNYENNNEYKNQYNNEYNNEYYNQFNKPAHYASVLVRDAQYDPENQQSGTDEVDNGSNMYNNNANQIKEVLIVLHQKTKQDITLRLSPSQQGSNKVPRIFVNDQENKLSSTKNFVVYSNEYPKEVLARAFVIEQNTYNGQKYGVKVETELGNLEVTYYGQYVNIRSNSFMRNNRGICGSFTGQNTNELKTPENKIVRNNAEFVASWAVIDDNSNAPNSLRQLQYRVKENQYPKEEIFYGNPISGSQKNNKPFYQQSENDYENSNNYYEQQQQHGHGHNGQQGQQGQQQQYGQQGPNANSNSISNRNSEPYGTKHQTQFYEDTANSRICFSKRPLPVCGPGTKANGKLILNVESYCRDINDSAAQQYKAQILRGRNLDMTNNASNKVVKFAVPKRCEQI